MSRHSLARVHEERIFVGQNVWARGYFVSTVGRDEEVIRHYTGGLLLVAAIRGQFAGVNFLHSAIIPNVGY